MGNPIYEYIPVNKVTVRYN